MNNPRDLKISSNPVYPVSGFKNILKKRNRNNITRIGYNYKNKNQFKNGSITNIQDYSDLQTTKEVP